MLRTNEDKLPVVAVQGQVWPCRWAPPGKLSPEGKMYCLQGTGGITYNAKIGDCCMGWAADHLEPGVTSKHSDSLINNAYVAFSCIGNIAEVKSGDAKGQRGFVTGKHGGVEHLLIYFPQETLEKLNIDDQIGVYATGQGLTLLDYPDIELRSISPSLLAKLPIREEKDRLLVGVAKIIPGELLGSGIGANTTSTGDYDVNMHDRGAVLRYGLEDLRFGDLVAITNSDTRFGREYRQGAVTIGVVIHGDCVAAGHGPGITTLMSCKEPTIEPFIDPKSNLADLLL